MSHNLKSEAFMEYAMKAWKDTVYRLAVSQLSSPHNAEDVCQDVFLQLLKDKTAFANDEHLKAWLLHVTINKCHDFYRTKWSKHEKTSDAPLRAHSGYEDELASLFSSRTWKALQALSKQQQLIMHLHYVEGYSAEEIACFIHCRPSTARTRLFRAREKLKKILGKEVGHERCRHAEASYAHEKCENSRLRD